MTLANERVSLSSGGALWGMGPSAGDLLDLVRAAGGVTDPLLRQRLAALHVEAEILRLIRLRTVTSQIRGEQPGPEASVRKVLADEHGQHVMALAKELAGAGRDARRHRARSVARPTPGATATSSRRPSRSAAAPARSSATSSPSAPSASPRTSDPVASA